MQRLHFKFNPAREEKKKTTKTLNKAWCSLPHLQLFKLYIAHIGATCRNQWQWQEVCVSPSPLSLLIGGWGGWEVAPQHSPPRSSNTFSLL